MKRKLLGFTALLSGFVIASSLIVMKPMQDPPTAGWNSVTTQKVC